VRTTLLLLASLAGTAHADRPRAPGGGEPCTDWCGHVQAWETAESGTGPETGPATILDLGAASETLRSASGERSEAAAVLGFEFRFPLSLDLDDPPQRALRFRASVQRLGWRVSDPRPGIQLLDAANPPTTETGGSIALGYTETLIWFSRWSKLAATLDAEGASGLGVRGGLGLRTLDTSTRAVGAAGLALGIHTRAGGLRGHARVLQALTSDPGWSRAVEFGGGIATRFDWPRFRGPWPIEVWADLRERRGGDAREREVTTGLGYVAPSGFSRLGIVAIATRERLADGTTGVGRALMFQFARPFGSQ
jgi:hypothetical protein